MDAQTEKVNTEKERVHGITDVFSKGIIYHMTSFGISKIFGILFTIVILNYFAAGESDLYFTANAFVSTISSIAGLGLGIAAIKFLPGMVLRKEGNKLKTEVLSAIVFLAILIMVFFVGAIIVPYFVPQLRFFDFEQFSGIAIIAFLLAFMILESAYVSSVLNAFKEFFSTSLINVIVQVLRFLILLALIYFGSAKAAQMLGGYVLSYAVVLVYLLWVLHGKIKKISGEAKIDFSSLEKSLKFGLPLYMGSVIDTFLTQMDIILIAYFLGDQPGIVSGYTAAILIIRNIAPMVAAPIITVQQPILVEEYERKSEMFLKITREVSRWAFYLGLPALLVFLAFDVAFLQIIAKNYVTNSYLMWLFAPFVIFTLLGISFRNSLMARGHVKTLLGVSVLMVALNFGLDWTLIPVMGVAGAAIGSSLSIMIGESIVVWRANRKFGATPHTDIFKALIAFGISLGLAFVSLPYFGQLTVFAQGGILKLVLSMTIVCLVYLAGLFLLKGFKRRDFETGLRFLEKNTFVWLADLIRPVCESVIKYTG